MAFSQASTNGRETNVYRFVLGLEVVDIEREASEVRRQTALAVSADGPSRLLIRLQDGGIDPQDQRDALVAAGELRSRFVRQAEAIRSRSTGPYATAGDDELFVDYPDAVVEQVDAAIDGDFDWAAFVETLARPPEASYQAYGERVAEILLRRAERLGDDAARRERLYVAVIVVTGGLAALTAVVVARSITRPLRSLAGQVMHAAQHGLRQAVTAVLGSTTDDDLGPSSIEAIVEKIAVESSDEVGEVATVMNTVQLTVVDLVVRQAILRRGLAESFTVAPSRYLATTSPGTSPLATASGCGCRTPPRPGSQRSSTCRPRSPEVPEGRQATTPVPGRPAADGGR